MAHLKLKVILFLSYFIFAVLLNSVGAVILQSISSFGVSKESASILEAFKDIPIAVVSFLVASWLTRFGYKRAMMVSLVLIFVACIAMPLLPGFITANILFLLVGAAFALLKISILSIIGLLTNSANQHASFMTRIDGFFMVGVLSGYWLFGVFVDSADPSSLSWLRVYWVLAVASAILFVLLYSTDVPESEAPKRAVTYREDFQQMMSLAWKPVVLAFSISVFLYVLIEQGVGTWLPTFNKEVLNLPQAMSIQATSIFAGSLALGRFAAGAVVQRLDWYRLLSICVLALGALVMIALPLANIAAPLENVTWFSAPIAAYVLPMIGFFMGPIYSTINSVILCALPKARHAAMAGLITVFSALGGVTGSLITGLTFAKFGGQTAFYALLVPIGCILFALYWLRRLSQHAGTGDGAPNSSQSRHYDLQPRNADV